jgi:signal transduction histidine kinase
MSKMTILAQKDLELAKRDLEEKQLLLEELANTANEKIKEAAKTNKDLKTKVDFLQELSSNLNDENIKLQQANIDLQSKKTTYDKLMAKLKLDLENLVVKEKQLEIQRTRLTYEVERKSKELALANKMAIVGQLSSRLAHDLRNPLTVIKNSVEILKLSLKNSDEKILDKFPRIENAIKKISYQIDDVLDFVRQSDLHIKRKSLSEIIDSSISNMIIPDGVKIQRDYRDVVVNGDSRKLEAVFTNLITNAIQAMSEKGEIRIKVFDDDEQALIKITDTGPGITKDTMNKMFEPLFTTKATGTGLGLSICKNIIQQHGGKIEVSSPPTVFTISIPKNIHGFYKATDPKLNNNTK